MQFGERIRSIRQAKGLTQTQVAGEHITRNMLSQIENGSASPSLKTLEHLSQVLGVTIGYLLSEDEGGSLAEARKLLMAGDVEAAYLSAKDATGDEGLLLLSRCCRELAQQCFDAGDAQGAVHYAKEALRCNAGTLYRSYEVEAEMLWLLACAEMDGENAENHMEVFRSTYDDWGWEAKNHLLRARHFLKLHQDQAAEREVWMITSLPESMKAQYLFLRGELAIRQEKYDNAISYLRQVENMEISSKKVRQELLQMMEIAYREKQDFKSAYEYAAKQRELQ